MMIESEKLEELLADWYQSSSASIEEETWAIVSSHMCEPCQTKCKRLCYLASQAYEFLYQQIWVNKACLN